MHDLTVFPKEQRALTRRIEEALTQAQDMMRYHTETAIAAQNELGGLYSYATWRVLSDLSSADMLMQTLAANGRLTPAIEAAYAALTSQHLSSVTTVQRLASEAILDQIGRLPPAERQGIRAWLKGD